MASLLDKLRAKSFKPEDLSKAVASRNPSKVADILTLRPDLANASMFNHPIFFSACEFDKVEMCRLFLAKGASLKGALVHTGGLAQLEIFQLLLEAGADIAERDPNGRTVMHYACSNSDKARVLPVLLAHGADINAKDNNGATPLHLSAQWTGGAIQELVETGADVNARDNNGKTPLHYAVEGNRGADITEKLLQCQADPNLVDADGKNPLDYGLLQGPDGRSHVSVLQRHCGKPHVVSPGRLLPGEFDVVLPRGTRRRL